MDDFGNLLTEQYREISFVPGYAAYMMCAESPRCTLLGEFSLARLGVI